MPIYLIIESLGGFIFIAAFSTAAYAAIIAARRFSLTWRLTAHERDYFDQHIENLRLEATHSRARDHTWHGYRKFTVIERRDEAQDICSFRLKPHDNKPTPPYFPGQFISFRLPTDDRPTVRCYSLSDAHSDDHTCQIMVKRVPPREPGAPPGKASSFLHDHINVGNVLDVATPNGSFTLQAAAHNPVVMIAGGIGVTPFLSMLSDMARHRDQRETWLFYCVTNSEQRVAAERMQELQKIMPNFHLIIVYSDPTKNCGKLGVDYHISGQINIDRIKQHIPSCNYEFFICAPSGMQTALVNALSDWGVEQPHIHLEAFNADTAGLLATPDAKDDSTNTHDITFARSDLTVKWLPSLGTILSVCENNGIRADSGCRVGNCRVCMMPIREGEVRYLTKPGCEIERGSCLLCCAVPTSNLVLDL